MIDEYPEQNRRRGVGNIDNARWAEYLRPDELHLGFQFRLCESSSTPPIRDAVANFLAAAALQNATPTWTLANHDVGTEVSRQRGGETWAAPGQGDGGDAALPGVSPLQRSGTGFV